jgi:hypothetical protein
VDFTENARSIQPKSVEFTVKLKTHEKRAELTELAWNSRSGVELAN